MKDNKGANRLARTIQDRVLNIQNSGMQTLDFATIQSDMSLLIDKFPVPVPDYMVCRSLTWGKIGEIFADTSSGEGGRIVINEKMRSLAAGDRVLVAWVGDNACVIDIILPNTVLADKEGGGENGG